MRLTVRKVRLGAFYISRLELYSFLKVPLRNMDKQPPLSDGGCCFLLKYF